MGILITYLKGDIFMKALNKNNKNIVAILNDERGFKPMKAVNNVNNDIDFLNNIKSITETHMKDLQNIKNLKNDNERLNKENLELKEKIKELEEKLNNTNNFITTIPADYTQLKFDMDYIYTSGQSNNIESFNVSNDVEKVVKEKKTIKNPKQKRHTWSTKELEKYLNLYKEGKSFEEISNALNLSINSILCRYYKFIKEGKIEKEKVDIGLSRRVFADKENIEFMKEARKDGYSYKYIAEMFGLKECQIIGSRNLFEND